MLQGASIFSLSACQQLCCLHLGKGVTCGADFKGFLSLLPKWLPGLKEVHIDSSRLLAFLYSLRQQLTRISFGLTFKHEWPRLMHQATWKPTPDSAIVKMDRIMPAFTRLISVALPCECRSVEDMLMQLPMHDHQPSTLLVPGSMCVSTQRVDG